MWVLCQTLVVGDSAPKTTSQQQSALYVIVPSTSSAVAEIVDRTFRLYRHHCCKGVYAP